MICRYALVAWVTSLLFLISATDATADPDSDQRTIVVRAVDSSGRPISGANILRSVWTNQKDFNRTEEFITDVDGVATISLPETMTILRIRVRKKSLPTLFANWGSSKIISLDEQLDHARKFIANENMDWPEALLGETDNPMVRKQLGISSVPVYYVLDPHGQLRHRSFRLSDAAEALMTELADQ